MVANEKSLAPPPKGRTLVVLVALACIGYAVACGILGGQVVVLTEQGAELGAASEEEYGRKREKMLSRIEAFLIDTFASGPSEVTGYKEAMDDVRRLDQEGFLRDGFQALADSELRSTALVLLRLDTALRIAFLVLGLALLVSMPYARKVGIGLCLAAIVVQVLTAVELSNLLQEMARAAQPAFEVAAEKEGLDSSFVSGFLEEKFATMPWALHALLGLVFPVVALLLLWRSRGLREGLAEAPRP